MHSISVPKEQLTGCAAAKLDHGRPHQQVRKLALALPVGTLT
jgi:hypothetical protein